MWPFRVAALALFTAVLCTLTTTTACSPSSSFPGPWDRYIQAPDSSRIVRASRIYYTEGDVELPTYESNATTILRGQGALVTFELPQNTGGRLCFRVEGPVLPRQSIGVAFTESPEFIGRWTDSTTDVADWDLTAFVRVREGENCFANEFARGAFRYVTMFVPAPGDPEEGQARPRRSGGVRWGCGLQQILGGGGEVERVGIKEVWVMFTAVPEMRDPRAYTGFFHSSDHLLNRIWYAGAYTLQLTTISPKLGGSLIDYNRKVDGNHSPPGAWYANFTISNGTTVTVDGAKRDRMVYAGDMTIAAPGIAVSTFDLLSIKNALQTLFAHHYHHSSRPGRIALPYAGPPMGCKDHEFSDTYHLHALLGVYQYMLYSGDFAFLTEIWQLHVYALQFTLDKINPATGLLVVTSPGDWLRPGMGGENIEAQSLLYMALKHSITLAAWLQNRHFPDTDLPQLISHWSRHLATLSAGVATPGYIFSRDHSLFRDNPRSKIHPQDGNALAVWSGLVDASSPLPSLISRALRSRWTAFGAPAPEAPGVISPFASAFELHAHAVAGRVDRTLALIRRQWGYLLDGPGFTNSTFAEGFSVNGDHGYPLYRRRNRNSHAHGWSAGPTSVLMEYVVGIRMVEPEGLKWRIEPALAGLESVEGGFETGLGRFRVKARELEVEIETPEGTEGVVAWKDEEHTLPGGCWRLWVARGGIVERRRRV